MWWAEWNESGMEWIKHNSTRNTQNSKSNCPCGGVYASVICVSSPNRFCLHGLGVRERSKQQTSESHTLSRCLCSICMYFVHWPLVRQMRMYKGLVTPFNYIRKIDVLSKFHFSLLVFRFFVRTIFIFLSTLDLHV